MSQQVIKIDDETVEVDGKIYRIADQQAPGNISITRTDVGDSCHYYKVEVDGKLVTGRWAIKRDPAKNDGVACIIGDVLEAFGLEGNIAGAHKLYKG